MVGAAPADDLQATGAGAAVDICVEEQMQVAGGIAAVACREEVVGRAALTWRSQAEVSVNFNACMYCKFFRIPSQLLGRRMQLRLPNIAHSFIIGCCLYNNWWHCEVRFAPLSQLALCYID